MKIGDEVICINVGAYGKSLTLYNTYVVCDIIGYDHEGKPCYQIVIEYDDNRQTSNFYVDKFVTLSGFRKLKLNNLLKDEK